MVQETDGWQVRQHEGQETVAGGGLEVPHDFLYESWCMYRMHLFRILSATVEDFDFAEFVVDWHGSSMLKMLPRAICSLQLRTSPPLVATILHQFRLRLPKNDQVAASSTTTIQKLVGSCFPLHPV